MSVLGTGAATADATTVPGLSNLSEELGLTDLLPQLPGLPSLPDLLGQNADAIRCTTVIQIGDSTSVNVDNPTAVPSPQDTLTAQYKRVGATTVDLDADGGRSIVERLGGAPNADQVVATHRSRGEQGCWVIAMGVNDAANISVGSSVDADTRINRIMDQLSGQPVLWPTVTTANPSVRGYDTAAMASFNQALRRAIARYPNLAVYDWAAAAQPGWFTDGIHYNSTGNGERNRRFADALATAFPPGVGALPATRWIDG
ncbi:MAG: SGNH/GDSL hydrolase family protein [Gordonia sp. (in: high G+C Gram-positive bacteria)]